MFSDIENDDLIVDKHAFYDINTYYNRNFRKHLTKDFINKVSAISWIQEPYAWIHGQIFKHLFKESEFLEQYLKNYTQELKLDLDLPFVG